MTRETQLPDFNGEEKSSLRNVLSRLSRGAARPGTDEDDENRENRLPKLSPSQVSMLVKELYDTLGFALDADDKDNFAKFFSSQSFAGANVFDILGAGPAAHEKAVKESFSKREQVHMLDKIRRLAGIAADLRNDPSQKPWLDIRMLATEKQRITSGDVKNLSDSDKEFLQFIEKVEDRGMLRKPVVPDPKALIAMVARFPNFKEPLYHLAQQAAFARLAGDTGFHSIPILLSGPAGVGKTHFALALAELFGTHAEVLSIASQSSGFVLAGLDRGYSSSKVGLILKALLYDTTLSPVVVLDEIDKGTENSRSDPLGPLYSLLEPRTSKAFRDEYAGFNIDASQIFWLATANNPDRIPGPLLSRFKVFEIAEPTKDEVLQIAQHVYKEMGHGLAGAPHALPISWQHRITGQSVRSIRLALQEALGAAALRAVMAGQKSIQVSELDIKPARGSARQSESSRIGFL